MDNTAARKVEETVLAAASRTWTRLAQRSRFARVGFLAPTGLLLAIAAIQIATMPSMFYPGDNFASRMEAMYWVIEGELGIPYAKRPIMGGMVEERGQYFFENDKTERFTSRYGFASTLMYLLPVWLDAATGGRPPQSGPFWTSQSLLLYLNLYHTALALVSAGYLYALARLYTRRIWLAVAFVVLTIYASIVWHYLRSPALEVFHIPPFLAMVYHALRFIRLDSAGAPPARSRWWNIAVSVLMAGALVSMKLFYVLVAAVVFAVIALSGNQAEGWGAQLMHNLRKRPLPFVLFGAAPWFAVSVGILAGNYYRFGSPFETGFSQWTQSGVNPADFSVVYIPDALWGFFGTVSQGKNVWTHFPLSAFALLAMPAFIIRFRREAVLVVGTMAIIGIGICTLRSWAGEFSYGPRLLVLAGMPIGLALVPAFDRLLDRGRFAVAGVLGALILGACAWTFANQIHINSLHPFVYFYAHGQFTQGDLANVPGIREYFDGLTDRAHVSRDIRAHVRGDKVFPPLAALKRVLVSHPDRRRIVESFEGFLHEMGKPNFWFAR